MSTDLFVFQSSDRRNSLPAARPPNTFLSNAAKPASTVAFQRSRWDARSRRWTAALRTAPATCSARCSTSHAQSPKSFLVNVEQLTTSGVSELIASQAPLGCVDSLSSRTTAAAEEQSRRWYA